MVGALAELVLFAIPVLCYRAALRRQGVPAAEASGRLGLRTGPARGYALAVPVLAVSVALGYLALRLVPASQLARHGVTVGVTAHTAAGYLALAITALAEELLFRGLIAGLLIRRYRFAAGNTLQALIFLAPHGLLLLISIRLWPLLPAQLIAGWLLGWLRQRTASIGPCWAAHTATNLIAAAIS